MAFPETDRIIYRMNPLADVTVQLRFPTILRIDSESPAAFQDVIRTDYPQYIQAAVNPTLPANLPPQIRGLIQGMGVPSGPIRHLFESEDRRWQVALTRETLELRTTAYQRWEQFRERVNRLRIPFEQIYRPTTYARVGIRYVDIVRRSLLGLETIAWSELLNPSIAGELAAPEISSGIDSLSRELHCRLDGDNSYLTLKTGFALAEPTKERCFLIDSDFHTHKRTEIQDVAGILDAFNRTSGRLFRWAIRGRLHDALQPEPIG